MIDPNKKEPLPVSVSEVCYRAFELINTKQYDDAEKLLANNMAHTDDDASVAVYHSVLGVLAKVRGEFKTAWKHYERAEKLLPRDPALKIISARLLIDQFSEYSQAIKRAKKVLEIIPGNPVFVHQAYTTMGLAFCRKGDRNKAVECFRASMGNDFGGFVSAKNIDFELLEALLKRGWGISSCRYFLTKAKAFADQTREEIYVNLLKRMQTAFDQEYAPRNAIEGQASPEPSTSQVAAKE